SEPTPEQEKFFVELNQGVDQQLITSDKINNGDLLRYYQDSGLDAIRPDSFDYRDQKARLEEIESQKGAQSSSLYSENNQKSTVGLYKTKTYQQYE
ncbi:MAG: LTA synthase family protein, partial [Enterococcus malodoratus]